MTGCLASARWGGVWEMSCHAMGGGSRLAKKDEVNSPYLVPQSSLSLSISRFALSADDGKQMD